MTGPSASGYWSPISPEGTPGEDATLSPPLRSPDIIVSPRSPFSDASTLRESGASSAKPAERHPAGLTPAGPSRPASGIRRPPPLPTLTFSGSFDGGLQGEEGALAKLADKSPTSTHHARPHLTSPRSPQRGRSLIGRLSTIRAPRRSRYGVLPDTTEEEPAWKDTISDDEGYDVPVDISGLDGGFAMKNLGSSPKMSATVVKETERGTAMASMDDWEGPSPPVERLNITPKPRSSMYLGAGMSGIVTTPFPDERDLGEPVVQRKTSTVGRMRTVLGARKPVGDAGASDREALLQEEAQRQADESGDILAVSETPGVDLSGLGGSHFESSSVLNENFESPAEKSGEKSYYFPEDPDMPSWRPVSMHWAYILLLTAIALGLAALQEYVCQVSIRKTNEDSGLLVFTRPQDVSTINYFAWKYAPTMGLLFYGILWQISDFEVKRLEPYYQLSKRNGATAAESLNIDYISLISYLSPFEALRHGHWAVVVSSTGFLLAGSVVPVLQSASVNLDPNMQDRVANEPKFVRITPAWSRATTAMLVLTAVCGLVLMFQLRRKSGLLSDPKGIAGVAAMATRSHILNDFRDLDTANQRQIHEQLKKRRYILHKSSLWQGEYIRASERKQTMLPEDVDDKKKRKPENPLPLTLRLEAGIPLVISIVLFAILIPVLVFTKANAVTQKVPWLFTLLSTMIKLVWVSLDGDIRMMEPYFILSLRNAPPSTLTLDYTGTIPGWLTIKAFLNKHYLVAAISWSAILAEVLTVCVSSFSVDGSKFFPGHGGNDLPTASAGSSANDSGPRTSSFSGSDRYYNHRRADGSTSALDPSADANANRYNSDETFRSFWISFALAMGCLFIMTSSAIAAYHHRRHIFLPRQPGTIASVLGFIHQSRMLPDFVGTEKLNSRQMTGALDKLGKRYGLGWFLGRDREYHCGIDEGAVQEYRHGEDPRRGRLGGGQVGTWEYY